MGRVLGDSCRIHAEDAGGGGNAGVIDDEVRDVGVPSERQSLPIGSCGVLQE
jgi:hypothetical protein